MKLSKIFLVVLTLFGTVMCLTSCMGPVGDAIAIPFAWLLRVFNSWTGHYALALLLFSLGVKIILLPLSIRQQKSQIKMARIRPKMLAIEKKYAGRTDQPTMRKKQEELMALQQAEGYSPMAGCLPLLIQIPIIFILFSIIREPLTYICQFDSKTILSLWNSVKGLSGEAAITKLSSVNQVELVSLLRENTALLESVTGKSVSILPRFDLFGGALNLGETPSFSKFNWLWLIPAVNLVLSIVSMRLTKLFGNNAAQQMQASTPDQRVSMGIMEWMMPVMTTFFAFQISAAVGVYWIYQSIFGVIQMIVLAKVMPLPKYTKEEMEQMLRDMKAKNAARASISSGSSYANGERPRSLHHIDDDEPEVKPEVKKQHQNPPKK